MKVWGQLENAQLENKSSDYSSAPIGRTWWNTTSTQVKVDDGTNIRALIRNDQKAVFGNNGTANSNIRLHRGAAGVLQFVTGGDTTAEGTLSTSLNQVSGRVENYTNAGKPAAANAGRLAWITDLSFLQIDTGAAWVTVNSAAQTSATDILNYTFTTSVGASAMTINLKNAAGNDPDSGDPAKVAFRNATAATGTYSVVSVTAATSIVITSGATLGHVDGTTFGQYIYIWALNNAGTLELAVSGSRLPFDEGSIQSTTIMNSSSDSHNVLYSTTARTNVPVRLLGRILSKQTTAGTYAANATEISLVQTSTWPMLSDETDDSSNYSFTGFGTTAGKSIWTRRIGNKLHVRGIFQSGTVAATVADIVIPSGLTIDSTKFSTQASTQMVGRMTRISVGANHSAYENVFGLQIFYDGSTTTKVFIAFETNTNTYTKDTASNYESSQWFTFEFSVPIAQYRSY